MCVLPYCKRVDVDFPPVPAILNPYEKAGAPENIYAESGDLTIPI